jgi:uncharacterized membrane protein YccC
LLSTTADAATAPAQARATSALTKLVPIWSPAAALRAVRTTIVAAGLFALTDEVLGNPQVATFAAFGSFATLLLSSFGGTVRDRLRAHLGLALAGSALLTIGTLVSGSVLLATLVTLPITFIVFYAGVLGPNAASGGIGAMLAYVLPVASPGTVAMIPDRLAGWWLASVVGTAAAIAIAPRAGANPLRAALRSSVDAIADAIRAGLDGAPVQQPLERCTAAKQDLLGVFTATPYRPLGLAAPDQALANVVQLVEWCTALVSDALHERADLRDAPVLLRELLAECATVLDQIRALFEGSRQEPELARLEAEREAALATVGSLAPSGGDYRREAQTGFHAQALAVAVLATGADALVAERLVTPGELERRRREFAGMLQLASAGRGTGRTSTVLRHASVRSVWFVNSLRAAAALSAAVLVAEVSSVQHGFWVVLGTLSVLRTSASATGSTALSALAGTVAGFVIGGVLLVVIGADSQALWAALPVAIFVAAYAPGTAPFALGQAAFTVTVAVLFNLLVPVGWNVGIVRIEDVALGCAVSVLVGVLLWPRGVGAVVADDLADCFRVGASFLREGIDWTVGLRDGPPEEASAATTTALRLDDALRAFLSEQGTKRLAKQELWRLVGGTLRLRLTAYAVATLPPEPEAVASARGALDRRASAITGFYDRLAGLLEPARGAAPPALEPPHLGEDTVVHEGQGSRYTVWLCEHLDHLADHLAELIAPAEHVAQLRRVPWWR